MKSFKYFAFLALILSVSCQKISHTHLNVVERNDMPNIEIPFVNDICVIETSDGNLNNGEHFFDKYIPVEIYSNALVTVQEIGKNYKDGHLGSIKYYGGDYWLGKNEARFYFNNNEGYTFDSALLLSQTVFTPETLVYSWDDFKNYGPIEKYINFRVKGTKGTLYVEDYIQDLENIKNGGKGRNGETSESALSNNPYYLKGKVKAIAEADSFDSPLISLKLYENYFKDSGFSPNITSVKGVAKKITISTETDEYEILITGRERDNDLVSFGQYVNIGDIVEIAIQEISEKIILSKNLGEAIYCRVLKNS